MIPKPTVWRSKKYRDAARNEDCKLRLPCCNGNPETTVLAHRPGSGMGTKSDDHDAVDACSACHDILDGRVRSNLYGTSQLEMVFDAGRLETIINRIERGILK